MKFKQLISSCTHLLEKPKFTNAQFKKKDAFPFRNCSTLFAIIAFLFITNVGYGQAGFFKTGWPPFKALAVSVGNATKYTDTTRASITLISNLGGGVTRLTLDASHKIGTFYGSQRALLIQMATGAGTNTGNWEEVDIYGTGTNTVDISTPSRSYTANTSGCANCRLQLIVIPYIYRLEITTHGSLECHEWDGYTGGILCFVTRRLEIVAGRISAAGKGHFDTYTLGQGGAGGRGDSIYNNTGGGRYAQYLRFCTSPAPAPGNFVDGGAGQNGEGLQTYSYGGAPTYTSGTHYLWPGCSGDQNLNMGNAGGGDSGQKGGNAGQGGGHGGKGGNNNFGVQGSNGQNGGHGGAGGRAGMSGRGGGIILFKCDTILISCANLQVGADLIAPFWINGQSGEYGKNGGGGGNGGSGGKGAQGQQTGNTLFYSGGNGGAGKAGIGAQGGDGGTGGQCGALRFYFNTTGICWITGVGNVDMVNAMVDNDKVMRNEGYPGKGGKGGKGGKSKDDTNPVGFALSTPYDTCTFGGPGSTWRDTCDCTTPMKEWLLYYTKYNQIINSGGSDSFISKAQFTSPRDLLTANTLYARLHFYDSSEKLRYHCNLEKNKAFDNWVFFVYLNYINSLGGAFDKNPVLSNNKVYFHDYTSTTTVPAMYFDIVGQFLMDNTYSPPVQSNVIYCGIMESGIGDTNMGPKGNISQAPAYEFKPKFGSSNAAIGYKRGGINKVSPTKNPNISNGLIYDSKQESTTLHLTSFGREPGLIEADLYSMDGRHISNQPLWVNGFGSVNLQCTGLPNGVYVVILKKDTVVQSLKLVLTSN